MQTKPMDSIELPAAVASFFAHQPTDPQAVARCFTEDAVVADEGHEHRGRTAIASWNAAAVAKYAFTSVPLTAESDDAHTTVRAQVSGNFPGSPVALRFHFTLSGPLIARLAIAP